MYKTSLKQLHIYPILTLILLFLTPKHLIAQDSWLQNNSNLSAGDTTWVMVACILVIFMTLPGLALFYSGMVRKKNLLGTMVHSYAAAALVSIIWVVIGYSLAFTPNNGFIGGLERMFLNGLGIIHASNQSTIYPGASTIPETVFMLFQMSFAIISAAIITGAFAERIKFHAMLLFTGLWVLLIYVPTAHWVWESGGWLFSHGVLDYAGGTVVHVNAGVAGLVAAIVIGKRLGYGRESMAPHNMAFTLIGAAMLWVGWFGFNAGSALSANANAGMAMLNTQISAAAGALTWLLCEQVKNNKPSALGIASGAVAGLVGVTPAAGFIEPMPAIILGILTSIVCFWGVTSLKHKLGYDDSLDAFGIHGIGGIVGAILTGVFASSTVSGVQASIITQILGVLITIVYSAIGSYLILRLVEKICKGLRIERDQEQQGLDLSVHGERVE